MFKMAWKSGGQNPDAVMALMYQALKEAIMIFAPLVVQKCQYVACGNIHSPPVFSPSVSSGLVIEAANLPAKLHWN